jgi:hypothetical protein
MEVIRNNGSLSERSVIFFLFLMEPAEFVNTFINPVFSFEVNDFLLNFKLLISIMIWIFEKLDNPKIVMLFID